MTAFHKSGHSRPWEHRTSHSRQNDANRFYWHGRVQPMQYDEPGLLRRAGGAVMRLLRAEGR